MSGKMYIPIIHELVCAFLDVSGAENRMTAIPSFTTGDVSIFRQALYKDGAAKITKDLCQHGLLPESVEFLSPSLAGYENGIGMMSAEEKMAASEKGYENGLGAMSAEAKMMRYENGLGAMSAEAKMMGYENGIGAMSAKERMAASAKGYENGLGPMSASAATKAAAKAAKWTVEVDASIESMIKGGVSFAKIASKLGNGLSKNDILNRWHTDLKKSSGIIKPAVQSGFPSRFTWTADVDATIVRMRTDGDSFAKIASELGNGLAGHIIMHRWNRHLKDK
jgi:hypothetical protein